MSNERKMVQCSVRPMSANDLDAVFALVEKFATSYPVEREGVESVVRHLMTLDGARLVVAEHQGEVVGYALAFEHPTLYASGRVAFLEEIMIREDLRRVGVGRALMADIEAWAKERGCKQVALATRRAAAFYIALGYEESAAYFKKRL